MGGADTLRNGDSGSVLREYHAGMDKEIRFSSELKREATEEFCAKKQHYLMYPLQRTLLLTFGEETEGSENH